ncbi:hypothetical protein OKA04_11060 [Luteolibacter flavescens]|uniref:Tetratricopeptide repeat protein n=1 Tax=Luteolibacter flavescens TaxID=1859460 RepID=A0ABT3FPM3_9BACT|nr:hypothetical protein [Luteolibacter flavescens]MCW1885269.1 hypothetical protein [Luteolibacter flavescens]
MAVRFPKKAVAWLPLACLLALLMVLSWDRASESSASSDGTADKGGNGLASRLQESRRERPAAKRNRSLSEAMGGSPEDVIEENLSAAQIHAFVSGRNRSMESLLSAFRLGGGKAYLEEALERFPDHPQVIFASLSEAHDPAKRLAVLENLKRVDPGNALGYCLSARGLLDLGKKDEALAELRQMAGKPVNDFTVANAQSDEEAYLSSDYPATKAKMAALFGSTKTEILRLRNLGDSMAKLQAEYESAGDSGSAQEVRDLQIGLGRQLQNSGTIVDALVGMVVEKSALAGLDSAESQARLEEMARQKETLTGNAERIMALMGDPAVEEGDWSLFFDRAKLFGAAAANDWMLEKYPGK